jgi:hypothetical protein
VCFYCDRSASLALWDFAGYVQGEAVPVCEPCAHVLLELIDIEGSYVHAGMGYWIAVPPSPGGRRRHYGDEWPPYREALARYRTRLLA